jgi:hypothetical protein
VGSGVRQRTGLSFEVTVLADRAEWTQQTAGETPKARRWLDERLAR